MKLSKGMKKGIEDMKAEALEIFKNIPPSEVLKIKRKLTKNKTFEFHVVNLGSPVLRIFINGKFYNNLIHDGTKWIEEEK